MRIESRTAFPPASASLRQQAKQENLLHIFLIAPSNFFQLRKRKFSCFAFLLPEELQKRSHPNRACGAEFAKGQKFLPPDPLPFCPFAYSLASRARRQGFLKKKTKELRLTRPTHSRATDINSLYFLLPNCFKFAIIILKG